MDGQSVGIPLVRRKAVSLSNVDKLKAKKKKRKRRGKEGKRSSASSTSATGSPDSEGKLIHKSKSACFGTEDTKSETGTYYCLNESLRWPKYKSNLLNLDKTIDTKLGKFPPENESTEDYETRINLYKLNRRKRYLAAQQELLNKFSVSNIYGTHVENDNIQSNISSNVKKISNSGSHNITLTSIKVLPTSLRRSTSNSFSASVDPTLLPAGNETFLNSNHSHIAILPPSTIQTAHSKEISGSFNSPNSFGIAVSVQNA